MFKQKINEKEISYKSALMTILEHIDNKEFDKKTCKIFIKTILAITEEL